MALPCLGKFDYTILGFLYLQHNFLNLSQLKRYNNLLDSINSRTDLRRRDLPQCLALFECTLHFLYKYKSTLEYCSHGTLTVLIYLLGTFSIVAFIYSASFRCVNAIYVRASQRISTASDLATHMAEENSTYSRVDTKRLLPEPYTLRYTHTTHIHSPKYTRKHYINRKENMIKDSFVYSKILLKTGNRAKRNEFFVKSS